MTNYHFIFVISVHFHCFVGWKPTDSFTNVQLTNTLTTDVKKKSWPTEKVEDRAFPLRVIFGSRWS